MAYTLNNVGFNVINSATNHCLDRGLGIQHSRSLWRQFKDTINVGVNDSEEDEQSIRVIEKNGIRLLGFLILMELMASIYLMNIVLIYLIKNVLLKKWSVLKRLVM